MCHRLRLLAVLLIGSFPAAAAGTASVAFMHPENFTDASLVRNVPANADSPALLGIRRHIQRLAARLPADQALAVEVLDVDLAGLFDPWRISPGIRTMTPATWPRIRLRFVLRDTQGRVLLQGEDELADMAYLQRAAAVRSTDPLRYEEPMLADWFDRRFTRR